MKRGIPRRARKRAQASFGIMLTEVIYNSRKISCYAHFEVLPTKTTNTAANL
jgi:hypothetical protein